jgi:hypothetical protein
VAAKAVDGRRESLLKVHEMTAAERVTALQDV